MIISVLGLRGLQILLPLRPVAKMVPKNFWNALFRGTSYLATANVVRLPKIVIKNVYIIIHDTSTADPGNLKGGVWFVFKEFFATTPII